MEETPEASLHTPAPVSIDALFVMLLHARQVALKLFLLHNAELFYLHNFPVCFLSKDVITDSLACVSPGWGQGLRQVLTALVPLLVRQDLGGCPITLVWEDVLSFPCPQQLKSCD